MPDQKVNEEAMRETQERANDASNASEEETSAPPATDPRQDDPDAEDRTIPLASGNQS